MESVTESQTKLLQAYRQSAQAPIEEAMSLPFAVYRDPQVHKLELEHVFRREWVFIVSEQELPRPGDYFAVTLAGEAIAIIRGGDGELRALSNLCRHRGTPLLDEGFGCIDKHIVCPYHAWAYSDEGALKAVPLPGSVNIEKDSHCLPQYPLQNWHGLLFVHLGENPAPLMSRLRGIDDYLQLFELDSFRFGFRASTTEFWHANWKLAMENAMESYHLAKVHKHTLETVTPTKKAFYIAGGSEWTLTGGEMVDTSNSLTKWLRGSYPKVFDHYVLISLPPSFVGILNYGSLAWIQVLPLDAEHCVVRSAGIAASDSTTEDKGEQAFVEAFFAEDKAICERVQTGMASELAQGGKLVSMERVVADFHQFLGSRLFKTPVSEPFRDSKAELFLNGDEH